MSSKGKKIKIQVISNKQSSKKKKKKNLTLETKEFNLSSVVFFSRTSK